MVLWTKWRLFCKYKELYNGSPISSAGQALQLIHSYALITMLSEDKGLYILLSSQFEPAHVPTFGAGWLYRTLFGTNQTTSVRRIPMVCGLRVSSIYGLSKHSTLVGKLLCYNNAHSFTLFENSKECSAYLDRRVAAPSFGQRVWVCSCPRTEMKHDRGGCGQLATSKLLTDCTNNYYNEHVN